MSTTMLNSKTVDRKWYVIDATDKSLGRIAVKAATLLRGKNKVTFTPHVDCGDFVIIVNCAKAKLTGKKLYKKVRYHHTGYVGHLKTTKYDKLMKEHPERAMQLAVKGMIPNNTVGRKEFLRLKVFCDSNHIHQAQKPIAYEV